MKPKQRQIDVARRLRNTFDTQVAAMYLREHGWSIEAAMFILLGK